jgi:molybdopterin-containing oxidoreductase family membrane subunit
MFEKALIGDRRYWGWLSVLALMIMMAIPFFMRQFREGLGITGLSRDVTWGFYIAQFTFLVGVAAMGIAVLLSARAAVRERIEARERDRYAAEWKCAPPTRT